MAKVFVRGEVNIGNVKAPRPDFLLNALQFLTDHASIFWAELAAKNPDGIAKGAAKRAAARHRDGGPLNASTAAGTEERRGDLVGDCAVVRRLVDDQPVVRTHIAKIFDRVHGIPGFQSLDQLDNRVFTLA